MKLILDKEDDEYDEYVGEYDDYDDDYDGEHWAVAGFAFISNIAGSFIRRGSAGLITLGLVSVVLIAGIVGLIMGAKYFRYIFRNRTPEILQTNF